ncbi:hypothetical protein CDEST_03973 [Colletotrichum destructivum]|uniref:Uncharacterized protein n=1 Tax=Colletotrichum destructivum TaxID=34406 RepID=A0AAX4I6T7_9PEZI|nr:hypothetical protein CDEST_03973 [Colletotrichum destructivum]
MLPWRWNGKVCSGPAIQDRKTALLELNSKTKHQERDLLLIDKKQWESRACQFLQGSNTAQILSPTSEMVSGNLCRIRSDTETTVNHTSPIPSFDRQLSPNLRTPPMLSRRIPGADYRVFHTPEPIGTYKRREQREEVWTENDRLFVGVLEPISTSLQGRGETVRTTELSRPEGGST